MRLVALSLPLLLAGCATPMQPFTGTPTRSTLNADQRVVWQASDDQDKAFHNSDATLDDPVLQTYVQGIVDRLYPEFHGAIHVHLLKSAVPNAFMMANGSCYVQLGILPLLQNEAQLAIVLGHEGIHFVDQHGVEERGYANNSVVTGLVLGIVVPFVAPMIAYSSIFGYSVDMETEADRRGYARFLKAGYAPGEAVAPFVALDEYSRAMGIKESYFYADHPKLQARIAYFQGEAAKSAPGGIVGRETYLAASQDARLWVLQELLARQSHKALIFLLEDKARQTEYPDWARYYLGRAYALRGSDGDPAKAEAVYRAVIAKDPGYAPTYEALGELLMQRGSTAEAITLFQSYERLAPAASDRAYIDTYLKRLTAAPAATTSKGNP